jgi:hypothetical protein
MAAGSSPVTWWNWKSRTSASGTIRWDCNFNGVTPETEEASVTDVTSGRDQGGAELSAADEQLLRELTERARAGGLKLTGPGR